MLGLSVCLLLGWSLDPIVMQKRLHNWLTLEQINERASLDLPRGTPLTHIDRYFKENKVEHSYYEKTNQVFAMINNIRGGGLFVSKGAQIIITLDQAKNLMSMEVKPVFTGP